MVYYEKVASKPSLTKRNKMRIYSALFIFLLASPSSVLALESNTAVLEFQHGNSIQDTTTKQFRELIQKHIEDQGIRCISHIDVEKAQKNTKTNCFSETCLLHTAKMLQAKILIGGRIDKSLQDNASSWTLSIWLYDTEQKQTLATVQQHCPSCSIEEAKEKTKDLVLQLINQAKSTKSSAKLFINSQPPDATISIDNVPVGITPMSFGVTPGEHKIILHKKGYLAFEHEVQVEADRQSFLNAILVPNANIITTLDWVKWSMAATAFATLTSGIVLWTTEKTSLNNRGSEGKNIHNYAIPGIVLTSIGSALAVGTGVCFWIDWNREKTGSQSTKETSVYVSYSGRF